MKSPLRASFSLRYKLPFLISALLCVVVAVLCWFGYRQIESVLVDATSVRLNSVTQQLGALLDDNARRLQNDLRAFARDSALQQFIENPNAGSRAGAERSLTRNLTAPVVALSLSTREGAETLHVGRVVKVLDADVRRETTVPVAEPTRDSTPVGKLMATDSGLVFRVHMPILRRSDRSAADTIGYVTTYRSVNGAQIEVVNKLIGANTTFLVGNSDGKLWTNFVRPVSVSASPTVPNKMSQYAGPDGETQLGVATPVHGTEWVALVQMPRSTVLAPARRFLFGISGIALLVVLVGGVGALVLSHQVTSPLADVSRAAEDIALGDYARRVTIKRSDEFGSLAQSFNSMAQQVGESNLALQRNAQALKSSNADLRDSERRYRQLVELLPDAIIVHRDENVVLANPAAITLFGADEAADVMNHSVSEFVSGSDSGDRARRLRDASDLAPAESLRNQLVHRLNGTTLQAETTSIPFTHDGKPAALMILRDVTLRERLEERVRQSQKMEAVGQLAGGVAHDFNNLLTVVTGYSAMLLAELPVENQMRADIQEIANAAERAATLTRQLLAFSRQQVLEPKILNLNDIVRDMEKMLRRVIPSAIRLNTRLDPNLGRISADPGQIEQVLMNLTVNARDAMPDGGSLDIETSVVEITESDVPLQEGAKPGRYIQLAVSDSGVGMSHALQARIFDPFFTTKPAGQGTGLGLSTVYGIVKQSGGHIWVYSEVSQGSVFRIYLPLVDGALTEQMPLRKPGLNATGTETILMVEDEPAVRSATRRILEAAGYKVLEAQGGKEALAKCESYVGTIHLLLTDIVMPEMSGRELGAIFRRLKPESPIVYMSGYSEDSLLRSTAVEPGVSFVQKPFTPQILTNRIRMVLDAGFPSAKGAS